MLETEDPLRSQLAFLVGYAANREQRGYEDAKREAELAASVSPLLLSVSGSLDRLYYSPSSPRYVYAQKRAFGTAPLCSLCAPLPSPREYRCRKSVNRHWTLVVSEPSSRTPYKEEQWKFGFFSPLLWTFDEATRSVDKLRNLPSVSVGFTYPPTLFSSFTPLVSSFDEGQTDCFVRNSKVNIPKTLSATKRSRRIPQSRESSTASYQLNETHM